MEYFYTIYCVLITIASAISICLVYFYKKNTEETIKCIEKENTNKRFELAKQYEKNLKLNQEKIISQMKENFDKDNVNIVSQAFIKRSTQNLIDTIKKNIETKFNRANQELIGGLIDESEGISRQINLELCEKIWDCFQNFKELNDDSPIIMPDGCKIAYTKGDRTVIVIQQNPQTRSVLFDSSLLTENVAKQAQESTKSGYRYNLSFPYVYFFIVFDKGIYQFHELYFRNKCMSSIREHIHLAPMPNIFRNNDKKEFGQMCMGKGMELKPQQTIAQQVDLIISEFWQKSFSGDLGTGGFEKIDKKINNYATWQKNTEENPLFILSVNWPKGKTIKGTVERLLEARNHNKIDNIEQEIRTQLENGVAVLTKKVKEEVSKVKENGLTNIELDQMAKEIIETILLDHSKLVFNSCIN